MAEIKSAALNGPTKTESSTPTPKKSTEKMNVLVFEADTVKGYRENVNDKFEDAIKKTNRYLSALEESRVKVQARLNTLVEAQADVFLTPREFDRHAASRRYIQLMNERRVEREKASQFSQTAAPIPPPLPAKPIPPQYSPTPSTNQPVPETQKVGDGVNSNMSEVIDTLDKIKGIWEVYFDAVVTPALYVYWPDSRTTIAYVRGDVDLFIKMATSHAFGHPDTTNSIVSTVYRNMCAALIH